MIPSWLEEFDAVLIINKVKQMFPYTCKRIVHNNNVSYCGDLTAWRPYFQLIIFSSMNTYFLFQIPFLTQRLLFTLAQQPAKSTFKGNRVD